MSKMIFLKQSLYSAAHKMLPLKTYMKLEYYYKHKKKLDLNNPVCFTEKLFWLKLYNKGQGIVDLIRKCYDKYTVREYIKEKGLESILVPLYAVYNNPDEIDFEELPEQFVLKVSQSSGSNIICPNKADLNIDETKEKLKKWLEESRKHYLKQNHEEDYVYDGNPVIICEKYLEKEGGGVPEDIRLFCFNGEPRYVVCDFGTTELDGTHGHNIKRNTYDLDWNLLPVDMGRPRDPSIRYNKPANADQILDIARILSKDFVFVRVDLYNCNEKIYFGELTWIPQGAQFVVNPDEYDVKMGKELILPNVRV